MNTTAVQRFHLFLPSKFVRVILLSTKAKEGKERKGTGEEDGAGDRKRHRGF